MFLMLFEARRSHSSSHPRSSAELNSTRRSIASQNASQAFHRQNIPNLLINVLFFSSHFFSFHVISVRNGLDPKQAVRGLQNWPPHGNLDGFSLPVTQR